MFLNFGLHLIFAALCKMGAIQNPLPSTPLRAAIVPDNDCVNKNQNKFSLICLIT